MDIDNRYNFIIIDGSFYLYKFHYAYSNLKNQIGKNIGAIYGVVNILKKLINQYHDAYFVIIFDYPGKTFRKELFKDYKSNRSPMPNILRNQIKILFNIIKALGISLYQINGVEADDVIGTLAHKAAKNFLNTLIITEDKDLIQLMSDYIKIYNISSNTILNEKMVKEKFGITPNFMVDYLSLVGDYSDNIPGVFGIGKKTAFILINYLGDLNNIYKNIEKIKHLKIRGNSNIINKLLKYKNQAFLSYKLAKIQTNLNLKIELNRLKIYNLNEFNVISLFYYCDFYFWIKNIKYKEFTVKKDYNNIITNYKKLFFIKFNKEYLLKKYKIIENKYDFKKLINDIIKIKKFIFNFKLIDNNIINICFLISNEKIFYLSININNRYLFYQFTLHQFFNDIKNILENNSIIKVTWNLKQILRVLIQYNIKISNNTYDIMLISNLIDNFYIKSSIRNLAKKYLNTNEVYYSIKNKKSKLIDNFIFYIFEETKLIFSIYVKLINILNLNKNLKKKNELLELPLLLCMLRIELNGILINKKIFLNYIKNLNKKIEHYELVILNKIKKIDAKLIYNINNNNLFFKIFLYKKNKFFLYKNIKKYISKNILKKYYNLYLFKSKYINKFILNINNKTKRLHLSYNQHNMLKKRFFYDKKINYKIFKNEKKLLSSIFISSKENVLIIASYAQIEFIILAYLTQDFNLCNIFLKNQNIYSVLADKVFKMSLININIYHINFINTFLSNFIKDFNLLKLSNKLNINLNKTKKYIKNFFKYFPKILTYIKLIKKQIYKTNNILNKKNIVNNFINIEIQNMIINIIKKTLLDLDKWLEKKSLPIRIIMQTGNKIIFETNNKFSDIFKLNIIKIMTNNNFFNIPLKVDIKLSNDLSNII